MKIYKYFLSLLAFICANTRADLCTKFEKEMSGPLKENVIGYARKRMPKRDISLIKYLSSNNWIIIYIDAPPSDPAFLFYKGLPEHRKFITLWAGAARKDEENDIFNWTRNNAPGIPEPLARCFAWYVTNSREP